MTARPSDAGDRTALIVVDVLNAYEHADAEPLVESMRSALPGIRTTIQTAREAGVPIVYVNDNYDDFSATRAELCARALSGSEPSLVEPLLPPDDVAFLTKARHSVFYETQLDYLLRAREVERIVFAGQVTEQCILHSALDAYVRHYSIVVPTDALAHIHADLADAAVRMMEVNMGAELASAGTALAPASAR